MKEYLSRANIALRALMESGIEQAIAIRLAGQPPLGWTMAVVSIVHPMMGYAIGEKLLKH